MLILFCMRGCGRIVRPAFPAPFVIGARLKEELARTHAGRSRRYGLPSLRGVKRRSNPWLSCTNCGLLRFARNDDEWCCCLKFESELASARSVRLLPTVRHAGPCAGHPRLKNLVARRTWMAGTSPAMTGESP